MNARSAAIKFPKLSKLGREIERWRKKRPRGARMPESLWSSAAGLAREYGLNRVASALGLDYYSLKKRVERVPPRRPSRGQPRADFVEIRLPDRAKAAGCVVEVEQPGGPKMRVELGGVPGVAELETVASALWRAVK
jgi:hypothetical protein